MRYSFYLVLVFFISVCYSQTERPKYSLFNINNVSTYFFDNGESDQNPNGNSGFMFPKGSQECLAFETGLMWGGKIKNHLKDSVIVSGTHFYSKMLPGRVMPADNIKYLRIFRVRPDYKTCDLSHDVSELKLTDTQIRLQYYNDWMEWPASDGAPFEDKNGNKKYDPDVDIPGVPGAGQTIWMVMNDLDTSKYDSYIKSRVSSGTELQLTVWGYNNHETLKNIVFREYKLINKSTNHYKDMYIGLFSDVEIYAAGNDFIACDSTLNLGYGYNGAEFDDSAPITSLAYKFPALLGYQLLKGPYPDAKSKYSAEYNSGETKGIQMTAFPRVLKSFTERYLESFNLNTYNFLSGLEYDGKPFITPPQFGSKPTKYVFSGDPLKGTGWNGSLTDIPRDQRLFMTTGPFELLRGDTQTVIFAQIAAGRKPGMKRLNAIPDLKTTAEFLKKNFDKISRFSPITKIEATGYDKKIILNWDIAQNKEIENQQILGYKFQGYGVYQLPAKTSQIKNGVLLATYDINDGFKYIVYKDSLVFDGNDTGLKYNLQVTADKINSKRITNYQKYYFAVVANYINPDIDHFNPVIQSGYEIVEVIAQPNTGDTKDELTFNQKLPVTRSADSWANTEVTVVNPKDTKTRNYEVQLNADGWQLYDRSDNSIVEKNIPFGNDLAKTKNFYVDGLELKLQGDLSFSKKIDSLFRGSGNSMFWKNITIPETWETYLVNDFTSSGFQDTYVKSVLGKGSSDPQLLQHDYLIKIKGTVQKNGEFYSITENTGSYATFFGSSNYRLSEHPSNPQPGLNKPFLLNVPFEIWDKDNNIQVNCILYDSEQYYNSNGYFYTYPSNYFIDCYIINTPFKKEVIDTSDTEMKNATIGFKLKIKRGYNPYNPNFDNDVLFLKINDQIPPGKDKFYFSSKAPVKSEETMKDNFSKINLFPNPCYGYADMSQTDITITHLPQRAEIIICNLAGQIVRRIHKDSNQDFVRWNLCNENGWAVGSGLYLVYVDLPDYGLRKVLKAALIQATL